jgi:hypothetical protein
LKQIKTIKKVGDSISKERDIKRERKRDKQREEREERGMKLENKYT